MKDVSGRRIIIPGASVVLFAMMKTEVMVIIVNIGNKAPLASLYFV